MSFHFNLHNLMIYKSAFKCGVEKKKKAYNVSRVKYFDVIAHLNELKNNAYEFSELLANSTGGFGGFWMFLKVKKWVFIKKT